MEPPGTSDSGVLRLGFQVDVPDAPAIVAWQMRSIMTSDTRGKTTGVEVAGLAPLASLGVAVTVFSGLVIVVLTLGLSAALSTVGLGAVCASLPIDSGPGIPVAHAFARVIGLAPGGSAVQVGPTQVCTNHSDTILRLADMLITLPSVVLALGALVIARRWLKAARMPDSFYTMRTARGMQFLGLYLAVGSIVAAVIESAANTFVITTLAHHVGWAPAELHFSVITLVVGFILIGLAHVMADCATMRQELGARTH